MKAFRSFLAAALLASALSAAAYAEENHVLSAGDRVDLGMFEGEKVTWDVLDAEKMNSGEDGIFLFSSCVLQDYGTVYDEEKAVWDGSDAQKWCADFYETALTPAEQAAVPAVSKTEDRCYFFGLTWSELTITNEHVFFISAPEMAEYYGPDDGYPGISGVDRNGFSAYYWLRTPHGYHPDYSGIALQGNQIHDYQVNHVWGTRPALNLTPERILFVSEEPDESGAYVLTLLDESLTLSVETCEETADGFTVSYRSSGAGENAGLCCGIADGDGKLLEMERLGALASEGTVNIPRNALQREGTLVLFALEESEGESTLRASSCAAAKA